MSFVPKPYFYFCFMLQKAKKCENVAFLTKNKIWLIMFLSECQNNQRNSG